MLIYKILLPAEWERFETEGSFRGSPLDRDSGFVHCSSRAQVGATAHRFFRPDQPLVVVALQTEPLGEAVRWEADADGEQFPHVYAALPMTAVTAVHDVTGPAAVESALHTPIESSYPWEATDAS